MWLTLRLQNLYSSYTMVSFSAVMLFYFICELYWPQGVFKGSWGKKRIWLCYALDRYFCISWTCCELMILFSCICCAFARFVWHWLDMYCNGWICPALAGYVLHWLDLSCIGWICLALARFVLHWLNLSFIGWICLALALSVLHWLDLSSVAENSLETGWNFWRVNLF